MFLLKSIPKIDKFVANKDFDNLGKALILSISKDIIEELRTNILNKKVLSFDEQDLVNEVINQYEELIKPSLQKVINATGVIVHTNLGRSLISKKTFEKVQEVLCSYNNLEYDLTKGQRSQRYYHISKIICKLLSCEDVLIVNNNASAVFLILNTFSKKKEVIVSRSELVEIGGSFRIPDVMKASGAKLVEVGTTNKTHLKDYKKAISKKTSMLMKVHKSNYSIEGFTSEVLFKELSTLAKDNGILDYYDMGSGHLIDLPYGLKNDEPSVLDYMKEDPSLLSFSGDKLLGSVQAGIIVGKRKYINKLKQNQLLRMLRVDKITLAILEENLRSILLGKIEDIPTLKMLFLNVETLSANAKILQKQIQDICTCELINTKTPIGGGTTPNRLIPSIALGIQIKNLKANKMEVLFRNKNIIGRIHNDKFLLDFRTIHINDIKFIAQSIKDIINE